MTAHWLIVNLGKDEHLQKLYYGVLEAGRTAEIINLGQVAEIIETVDHEKKCVVVSGSIWCNSALRAARPNWIGNFHNKDTFKCSAYYPSWGKFLSQKKYMFLPLSEIIRQSEWVFDTLAVDGCVFLRPDSGEKEFAGDVVHRDMFRGWTERILPQLEWTNTYNETKGPGEGVLCVVSSPIRLKREFRLVVADKKVVAGSLYRVVRHVCQEPICLEDNENLSEFAEKIMNDSPPNLPPFHNLDIAEEEDGRLSIMEVGCFCCSGLYECDRRNVAEGVSRSAELAYEKVL